MRKIIGYLVCLPLVFSLCSCAKQNVTVEQILLALTEAEIGLPAGQIYLSSASEEQATYLSPDLIAALYGQGEPPWQLSLIEDYGLFLSTAQHPCEFAVFRCYAHSDTDEVAAMCHVRLDALRIHYKDTQYATQYAYYVQNARVVVIGNYVLLLISSDPEHAFRAAKGVI